MANPHKKEQESPVKECYKRKGRDWDIFNFSPRRHIFARIFWSMFFLIAAAAIAAQIFGFLTFSINIWWLILVIFLTAIMVSSLVKLNWFMVFVPMACIATIANYQTDLLNLNGQAIGGLFGIAVLVSIAFSILFRRRNCDDCWKCEGFSKPESSNERQVAIQVHFGSAVRYIESKELEKVLIDSRFGGVKVYFNNAIPAGKELNIMIDSSFSGIEMYIPRNWRIINGLDSSFGGIDEKNRTELTPDSPTVHLVGNVNLSGVEIIYI
ncbi:hypothetical protein FWF74_01195 [Candidatus Saccharibacteria bacterium]|nr:hypothetical protein [Candidatus Saccharibacteria bacterium]MCL1963041.1 hypothetical protein [Candidatus Saccharibacteria bacterium]